MTIYSVEVSAEAHSDVDRQMADGHFSSADFRWHDLAFATGYIASHFDDLPQTGLGLRQLAVGPEASVTCPYYRLFVTRSFDEPFGVVIVAIDIAPQSAD